MPSSVLSDPHILTHLSSPHFCEVGAINISTLQMEQLRLRGQDKWACPRFHGTRNSDSRFLTLFLSWSLKAEQREAQSDRQRKDFSGQNAVNCEMAGDGRMWFILNLIYFTFEILP